MPLSANKGFRLVVYSRDRHPPQHGSFSAQGGPWPEHCVEGTSGFAFRAEIAPSPDAMIIDKGGRIDDEGYDAFTDTGLADRLRSAGVTRVAVAGLAIEYCVRATALGAARSGFETWLILDATEAVDQHPGDRDKAILEMRDAGIYFATTGQFETIIMHQPHPSALVIVDVQNDFFPGGALPVSRAESIIPHIRSLLEWGKPIKQRSYTSEDLR